MAQEVEVKLKVDTGSAVSNVEKLDKSIQSVGKSIDKTKEAQSNYGKQLLEQSGLTQKLSQATGGVSDVLIKSVKGIDMASFSFKGLRTAIASTGIGLLGIALAYLVEHFDELGGWVNKVVDYFSSMGSTMKNIISVMFPLVGVIRLVYAGLQELGIVDSDYTKEAQKNARLRAEAGQKEAERLQKTLEKTADSYDFLIAKAKANGDDTYELEKKKREAIIATQQAIYNQSLAYMKSGEATKEQIEAFNENKKALEKNLKDARVATIQHNTDLREKQKEANDKARDARESANKEAMQQAKALHDALQNLEKKYSDDIENIKDNTEQKKLDRQKQRALKELDEIKLSDFEKKKALSLIDEDFKLKQEALDKSHADKIIALTTKLEDDKKTLLAKTDEEKLALAEQRANIQLEKDLELMGASEDEKNIARQKLKENYDLQEDALENKRIEEKNIAKQSQLQLDSENEKLEFDIRLQALIERDALIDAQTNLTDAQRLDAKKKNGDLIDALNKKVIASEKAKEDAKYSLAKSGITAISSLTSIMLGEGKKAQAIQKGLTLAQIGIDTASAFSHLMSGSEAAAVATGPAYPFAKPIFYASGIIQILANVMKAKQALSSADSGGGGDGGGASATPVSPPAMSAPSINVVGASSTNAIAETISQQGQQPIKAYVVGNEVTSQQSLDRNILKSATLG